MAFDVRAHFRQRADDAIHGPHGKRFIAANARGEALRRQDSGEHAYRGAGIAGVELPRGFAQRAAMDDDFAIGCARPARPAPPCSQASTGNPRPSNNCGSW